MMKNRGSVLQITLVLWSLMIATLFSLLNTNNLHYKLYKNIDILMKQKNIEVLLVKYYIETMQNDLLLSDCFSDEHYLIEYYIEDMWSYYIIDTYIEFDEISYGFTCQINTDDFKVTLFEYL